MSTFASIWWLLSGMDKLQLGLTLSALQLQYYFLSGLSKWCLCFGWEMSSQVSNSVGFCQISTLFFFVLGEVPVSQPNTADKPGKRKSSVGKGCL